MGKKIPFADLHCHSTASDGSFSPQQLIWHAKANGLKGLCITDHDTVQGCSEAIVEARKAGIHLGAGVEFSCVFEGFDLHLIGYDVQIDHLCLQTLCDLHLHRRYERNLHILEKLAQNKIVISAEVLYAKYANQMVGRPHIAQMMVDARYVGSVKEAFYRYLGSGKSSYVQGYQVSVEETLEAVKASKGKLFIAHPHLLPAKFPLPNLLKYPFDGMECFYGNFSDAKGRYWAHIAKQKKWIMSAGSDFHGDLKPHISLGSQGVDEETFYQIFERPLS